MFKVNWHYLWRDDVARFPVDMITARPNLRVVFLERRDVLAQAVSNEINVRYRHGEIAGHPTQATRPVDPPAIHLDCKKVRDRVQRLRKWRNRTHQFLQCEIRADRVLRLTYEELTGNQEVDELPSDVNEKLCAFFDVCAWTFKTRLRKVHQRSYSEIVENWEEIAQCVD
jgi:LPS sulfotransferase NodH